MRGLSLVAASGGHSSSRCAGLSLSQPLPLRSTGSRCTGSAIVAHGPSRSVACGIFPDQGSNPCPLHWQADSQPLRHQGSPINMFLKNILNIKDLFQMLVRWIFYNINHFLCEANSSTFNMAFSRTTQIRSCIALKTYIQEFHT